MILNSRRAFLKTSFLTTAVIVMSAGKLFGAVYPLDTMVIAAEDLFAHAKKLEVDVRAYLLIILHHTRVTEEEKTSIRNGAQWLNEEAVAQYKKRPPLRINSFFGRYLKSFGMRFAALRVEPEGATNKSH